MLTRKVALRIGLAWAWMARGELAMAHFLMPRKLKRKIRSELEKQLEELLLHSLRHMGRVLQNMLDVRSNFLVGERWPAGQNIRIPLQRRWAE